MDNQTNPTTTSEKQESKVPEPPALEIDIRTMESDIKAFKEGGGETPTAGVQEAFVSQRDGMQQAPAAAYAGPEKPLFETPVAVQQPRVAPSTSAPTSTLKVILITASIIIAVAGLGLLGYFVLFPQLFKLIGK
jgi:hypothetical protein